MITLQRRVDVGTAALQGSRDGGLVVSDAVHGEESTCLRDTYR